jgi:hypothetical protein
VRIGRHGTLREVNRKLNMPKTAEVTPVAPVPVPPRDSDENWTKTLKNLVDANRP